MKWSVEYYETKNGKMPAYEFINNLPVKLRAKAFKELELLEEFGPKIKMPYSRHIKEGLHELRIKHASDIARVFNFFFVGEKIILTNVFIKKTQKIPKKEIEKALQYKIDYEERFSG